MPFCFILTVFFFFWLIRNWRSIELGDFMMNSRVTLFFFLLIVCACAPFFFLLLQCSSSSSNSSLDCALSDLVDEL